MLASATWEGELDTVLQAAPRLCDELLERLGQPADEHRLAGIETRVPQTVDVARAYYRGVGAFEDGDYPEALGHSLEGAAHEHDFLGVDRAVIRLYYLLGQTAHAVVFADSAGRRLEREGRLRQSLEFTFAAAEHCLQSLDDPAAAIRFLERMVAAAERHEARPISGRFSWGTGDRRTQHSRSRAFRPADLRGCRTDHRYRPPRSGPSPPDPPRRSSP